MVIQSLEGRTGDAKITISDLNNVILQKEAVISELVASAIDIKSTIDALLTERNGLTTDVEVLKDNINDLTKRHAELVVGIDALLLQRAAKEEELRAVSDIHTGKVAEQESYISQLESKAFSIKQDMAILQKTIESERSELANRKLALDDRERVLRRREQRAAIQESSIQQNASLLEL